MDKISKEQRHYNMAQIHGSNTELEVLVRKYLFHRGLRYRKNDKRLPGHPDIVLPKYKTVVFVNGCFWHGHENCPYSRLPKTNTEFWRTKIQQNRNRDFENERQLQESGWRVLTVWGCEIKKKADKEFNLDRLFLAITTI